jgi:hypothetical protein
MRWSRAVADGLLIGGAIHPVPGVTVYGPGELDWIAMQWRDGRKRTADDPAPRMFTNHTTEGSPQHILAGSPTYDILARIRKVLDHWRVSERGSQESGCAAMVACGKVIVQLVDLLAFITYHAGQNGVNVGSVGNEMVQDKGAVYSDTIDTTIEAELVIGDVMGIPFQTTSLPYRANTIIRRLRHGGPDVVGHLGHRDNAWKEPQYLKPEVRAKYPDGYADRGQGDPGDEWYRRIKARGALQFNYDAHQDIAFWMRVQDALNTRYGTKLKVDGICGQRTVAAMRKHGLWNGGVFPEFPVP